MTDLPRPEVILDIIEEHFEELDFLWEQRESVIFAPDWTLDELAELEERAEAHLDGLRLAEGHAVDLARPALGGDEPGAATAATLVMTAFDLPDLDRELVAAFEAAEPEIRNGIRIGLRHTDVSRIVPDLERLASADDPDLRLAALDVLAFHRLSPPHDLERFAAEAEESMLVRLYPSLARFGGPWSAADLDRAMGSEDATVQRAGLEAAAWLGTSNLPDVCRRYARRLPVALEFLGVVGEAEDLPLFRQAMDDVGMGVAALAGLGAMGWVEAIPWLIEAMRDDETSHLAGAAFVRITGAPDVASDELPPPPEELSEDDKDLWDPPVPADPETAAAWWEKEKARFDGERRWQAGVDLTEPSAWEVFDSIPLKSRRDAYLRACGVTGQEMPDTELEARVTARTLV